MNDLVQPGALVVVAEGLGRKCRPVQCAVGSQDVLAELLHQGSQPLGARLDDLAGDDVTVDNHAAALGERGRHRRLAGADAAGEPDSQHVTAPRL